MKTLSILLLSIIGSLIWIPIHGQTILFTPSDTTVCAEDPTVFINHYPNLVGYTYNWDFGDFTYSNASGNATHTYHQTGTMTPSLTITGDSFLYVLKSIKIHAIPGFFLGGVDFRADLYIRVKDSQGKTIISTPKGTHNNHPPTTFGGYSKVLGLQNYVIHVYEFDRFTSDEHSAVSFSVPTGSGKTTNSDGLTVSWVIDSIPLFPYNRTIQALPPLAKPQILAGTTTSFCGSMPTPLSASGQGGLHVFWRKDGVDIPGATGATYLPTQSGHYQVIATNGSCKRASDSVEITIIPLPNPPISASGPLAFCDSGTVTLSIDSTDLSAYQWYHNNQPIAGAFMASYTTTQSGDYHVAVTDTNGCMGTSAPTSFHIYSTTTQAAVSSPNGQTAVCEGDTLSLSATAGLGLTYQWLAAGQPIAGATQQDFAATDSGMYQVLVQDPLGCAADTSGVFPVNLLPAPPAPIISAADPTAFCEGNAVLLASQGTAVFDRQWQKDQLDLPGENDTTLLAMTSGNFALTIADSQGCKARSSAINVTVFPTPMPVIVRQNDSLIATPVDLSLLYQWFKDGVPIPNEVTPYYLPTISGTFTVKATSAAGCEGISDPIFSSVGIADQFKEKIFTLYPNPTKDDCWIEVSAVNQQALTVKLYDLQGRVIDKQILARQADARYPLKMSHLPSGQYVAMLFDGARRLGVTKVWKRP